MKTFFGAAAIVAAIVLAPIVLPGEGEYLAALWVFRGWVALCVVLWALVVKWLVRRALVAGHPEPGATLRARRDGGLRET